MKRIEDIRVSLDSDQVIQNSCSLLVASAILLLLPSLKKKLLPFLRSWWNGLVSFLSGLAFIASLASILLDYSNVISISCGLIALLFVAEFKLQQEDGSQFQLNFDNSETRWSRLFGPSGTEPISAFEEDLADRKLVVSTLSRLALGRQEPIIALNGAWGTGKSSVLRLLQSELESKAIVVQFNAWLPGTETTFAKQLMAAIATECSKHYSVPGLQRSLRTFAQLVAGSVKQLEIIRPFFPTDSQQVEIEKLISGINRVPKRIVVLIDEIDRMDIEEASVLLKILRGAPTLSKISFICAVNLKALEEKLNMNKHELEKFMPLTIRLQPPDPLILKDGLELQFEKLVKSTHWSQARPNGVSLTKHASTIFDYSLKHQFSTFRALRSLVGLFSQIEEKMLVEVNPLDMLLLVAIELRSPQILDFIVRKSDFLVEHSFGQSSWRPTFEKEKNDALNKLSGLAEAEEAPEIFQILCELFPIFAEHCAKERKEDFIVYRDSDSQALRDARRVALSDFAWAYFRGFLSEDTLSQNRFSTLLDRLNQASTPAVFARELRSFAQSIESEFMLKDFWWRLARVKTFPQHFQSWVELVRAIVQTSDLYSSDVLGYSYRSGIGSFCVTAFWNALENVPIEQAKSLLSEAILFAPKDAFALQLTKDVEDKRFFDIVQVNQQLDPTLVRQEFLTRMNRRYANSALSHSPPDSYNALMEWANHSETDKKACHNYFRTLLQKSPGELPRVTKVVFPAGTEWGGKEQETVSSIFPLQDLKEFVLGLRLDDLHENEAAEVSRFRTIFGNDLDVVPTIQSKASSP